MFDALAEAVLAVSPAVRHVALGAGGHVSVAIERSASSTDLAGAIREALHSTGVVPDR